MTTEISATTEAGAEELTFAQLIEQASQEYEQVQKELREIDMLIQQSSSEVEKLAQRNAQINNKVRMMEGSLDTMPRQDIQEIYKAAQDAQNRLFMMRGQVEQLQGKQQYLNRYAATLNKVIESYHEEGGTLRPGGGMGADAGANSQIMNIINAQENERLSLSKELHDGPAQSLTNLILQAEICERLFDSDPGRAKTELATLKESVNGTFRKIREYIFELRPMILDDLGLAPTLKQHVQDYENKHHVSAKLNILSPEQRLPPHIEVTMFRVIQSLLKNTAEHAHATTVEVTLDIQPDMVTATVRDDGSGFNVEQTLAEAQDQKRMGLISIQERLSMLGGEMTIDSGLGDGTRINVRLPLG
jgi:two-component system sensor histidine kinase DegS